MTVNQDYPLRVSTTYHTRGSKKIRIARYKAETIKEYILLLKGTWHLIERPDSSEKEHDMAHSLSIDYQAADLIQIDPYTGDHLLITKLWPVDQEKGQ